MRDNDKFQQLLSRIPEKHLTISEVIITYAENFMGTKLNDHIHIVLTDHTSFAIERAQNGLHFTNKLLHEIKILYSQGFEIGLWAVNYISEKFQVDMLEDEAAFIALHLHTMKPQGSDLHETLRQTSMIKVVVQAIQQHLSITLDERDLSYHRLITHLRFSLTRINDYEVHTMDKEMLKMIKKKCKTSFKCAKEVTNELQRLYTIDFPEQELGYITLHIERLRKPSLT